MFYAVQTAEVFPDSKTFVDQEPKVSVAEIRKAFEQWEDRSEEGLRKFVDQYFELPTPQLDFKSDTLAIEIHIKKLWSFLKREQQTPKSGTLIALQIPMWCLVADLEIYYGTAILPCFDCNKTMKLKPFSISSIILHT